MNSFVLGSTATAEWHALVSDAQAAAEQRLDEELQSYLVFLLMRFTQRPEIAASVLALDFLQSMQLGGGARRDRLREVGDKCLLFAGLFPRRAARRRVRVSYFVDLGRGAYRELSDQLAHGSAEMYKELSGAFVALMDVLQAMRELGDPAARLGPLEAYELWNDTASPHALRSLRAVTAATPILSPGAGDDPEPT